jgi:nucleoside-diphosphate-sugar epimerase
MVALQDKIVITGAAGLVGQNLILMLRERGYSNLVAIDKKKKNIEVLRQLNPGLRIIGADLAVPGDWRDAFAGCAVLIQLHAQIGGENYAAFEANNITATRHVLEACHAHNVPHIVHISSSVVNSMAVDFYAETKKAQEKLVAESGISFVTLRPTLMFGWFDRKHLGWLSRFMKKSPVFPVPNDGRYLRQPLYERDFCAIILSCLARAPDNKAYNITGMEKIDYIDIIRAIRKAVQSKTLVLHIPYALFRLLLRAYALIDRDPPFTVRQLEALVLPETFEVIPWDKIFSVAPTPFAQAVTETYTHPVYSDIVLEF